jgi:hypothetical protein
MGRKRFATTILIAALALVATAASAGASASEESQFVSKINAERSQRGLRTLTVKSDLVDVARRHSREMAAQGDLHHNNNLPKEVDGWTALGENVGVGPDVDELHQAFMDSLHHRENILERDYNQVGIGVVVDDDGTVWVTEVFAARKSSTSTTSSAASPRTGSRPATHRSAPRASRAIAPARASASARPEAPVRSVDLLRRLMDLDAPAA